MEGREVETVVPLNRAVSEDLVFSPAAQTQAAAGGAMGGREEGEATETPGRTKEVGEAMVRTKIKAKMEAKMVERMEEGMEARMEEEERMEGDGKTTVAETTKTHSGNRSHLLACTALLGNKNS